MELLAKKLHFRFSEQGVYLPPTVHNPPIMPMTTASQGLITFAGAVIETRPPKTPPTNSGIFNRYSRLRDSPTFKRSVDNPPPMAPFIVTTATRVAVFQLPVFEEKKCVYQPISCVFTEKCN